MNTSFFVTAWVAIAMVSCTAAATRNASGGIIPHRSFIILSRAAWGCLRGQEVTQDVSDKIAGDDSGSATIYEIKNPEDVSNRYELHLLFPAVSLNGLPGYFTVKFWCDNDKPKVKAFLSLEQARLYRKENQWLLSLKLKGNGFIHGQVLYSRTPEIRQAWFSCPAGGDLRPYQLTFFSAYPLEGRLGGMPRDKLSGRWQTLELRIDEFALDASVNVDRCQALLDELDRHFAESDRPLVWRRQDIRPDSIREVLERFEATGPGNPIQILLKVDDRSKIQIGHDNFLPHLRQKLTLVDADGKLVGAELSIGIR